MMKDKSRRRKVAIGLAAIFISLFIFTQAALPKAQAQFAVLDPANLGQNIWQGIKWVYDKLAKQAIATAFKTSLKVFLSQVAYDTATYLAEGDRGKKPLFITEGWDSYVKKAGDAALGSFMDELTKGFGRFNICEPSSLNVKLAIHYSLFQTGSSGPIGYKPRCSFSEMQKNWTKWQRDVRNAPSKFVRDLQDSFKGEESDVGLYLTLHTSLITAREEAKLNALLERSVNKGIKDITSPITRSIKTPALLLGEKFAKIDEKTGQVEMTYTGEIVDSFLGTFTNTLMSKWMDTLFKKGFNVAEESASLAGLSNILNNNAYSAENIRQRFASLASVSFTSGQENVLDKLVLPSVNPLPGTPAGPWNEVITDQFASAVRNEMTVAEAIKQVFLDGSMNFGFNSDGSEPSYRSGYPYRSLVILRTQRIIPVGWEIAALYYKNYGQSANLNLNRLIHCYEDTNDPGNAYKPDDCKEDTNGNGVLPASDADDYNPYYHLVDPNWVLKSPETFCKRKGSGPEVVSNNLECLEDNVTGTLDADNNPVAGPDCAAPTNPDIPVRLVQRSTDYCGDWQSCLLENDDGSCAAYGYCTKEKSIWRFQGEQCPSYYNSCENFATPAGQKYSYLRNTLKSCSSNEAGCSWFSTEAEINAAGQLDWSALDEDRLYLNEQAESCPAGKAGCTKLGRMVPGINLALNGNFAQVSGDMPLGWSGKTETGCVYRLFSDRGETLIRGDISLAAGRSCGLGTSGYIPINPEFTYQLSLKIKGPAAANVFLSLAYYEKTAAGFNFIEFEDFGAPISLTPEFQYVTHDIGPAPASFNHIAGAQYVRIEVIGPRGPLANPQDIWVDDVQFNVLKSPVLSHNPESFSLDPQAYRFDYSLTNSNNTFLKIAPDYLNCQNASSVFCDNYAQYCKPEEVGCQGYVPVSGGPEIPAKVTSGDLCPAECNNFQTYLESNTYFELVQYPSLDPIPFDFIASTAQKCPAQEVGCEEFTNLDEVAQGGEGREYYTYLRQCVSEETGNINAYFTWEGSDTEGFQLKRWNLLQSNLDSAPCTNIQLGTNTCIDDAASVAERSCTAAMMATDPNCREFIDSDSNSYFRLQQYTVTASGNCHAYRRTLGGQVYNADPAQGRSCAPSSNACHEYKGNFGNNVRNLIDEGFENGTIGDFVNSDDTGSGLHVSNEALYRGGHSLAVQTTNDILMYRLDQQLRPDKQYKLTFWARKYNPSDAEIELSKDKPKFKLSSLLTEEAQAAVPVGANFLNFTTGGLTEEWQIYNLDTEVFTGDNAIAYLRLTISGLVNDPVNPDNNEAFYIDNIVLQEYATNYYLIRNSWNTPLSCNQPINGAQLGCQAYRDRTNTVNYLKSFSSICDEKVIGCEAFVDTQNSSFSQAEQTYMAICDDAVGEVDASGICRIRGVTKCTINLPLGETSCEYQNTFVDNDSLIYTVNDPAKYCTADEKGCQAVGQPQLNRANEIYTGGPYEDYLENYVEGFATTYMINDPDRYNEQLCSEGGLYCLALTGEQSGTGYYYDPFVLGTTNDAGERVGRTCYYDSNDGKWKQSSDPTQECSEDEFLPAVGQDGYEDWAGVCSTKYSTCTEYRDPEKPHFEKAQECDASISPQTKGICGDGDPDESFVSRPDGHQYCLKTISGITHDVCQTTGVTPCEYTENDWYCFGSPDSNCNVPGTTKKACYIAPGNDYCLYSLACEAYYYKANGITKCENGTVDRDGGCLLFNDTSDPILSLSSNLSQDGQSPKSPNSPPGCSSDYNSPENCDANTVTPIKVKPDRECSESLFCSSSVNVTNTEGQTSKVCLDLGKCRKLDPANPANCLDIVVSPYQEYNYYNFSPSNPVNGVDNLENLSGYSRAGLVWYTNPLTGDPVKWVDGHFSPEDMVEVGSIINIENGDFESPSASIYSTPGWNLSTPNCSYTLDNQNAFAGQYSLKTTLTSTPPISCAITPNEGLRVDAGSAYLLSFYARSENGAQIVWPQIRFVDGSGNNTRAPVTFRQDPPTYWKYYEFHFGAGTGITIPANTQKLLIDFRAPFANVVLGEIGSIWLDNIEITPGLEVSPSNFVKKDCRLYPEGDSLACEYTDLETHRGWYGYCLEYDPQNPKACVQWYPVDSVAGDSLVTLGQQSIGYSDRLPLYYCLQSAGNNNLGYQSASVPGNMTNGFAIQSHVRYGHVSGEDDGCGYYSLDPNRAPFTNVSICNNHDHEHLFTLTSSNPNFGYTNMNWDFQNIRYDDVAYMYLNIWEDVQGDDDGVVTAELIRMNSQNVSNPGHGIPNGNYFKYSASRNSEDDWEISIYFVNDPASGDHKKAKYIYAYFIDATAERGGMVFNIFYNLKETCTYLAKVAKEPGTGVREKPWYTRYNYGWNNNGPEGNTMGYTKDMLNKPYASSPLAENLLLTDIFVGIPQAPADIGLRNFGGLPYSVAGNRLGRSCVGDYMGAFMGMAACSQSDIGDSPESSTKDCHVTYQDIYGNDITSRGVCTGVGQYCYNTVSNLTNGTACVENSDCPPEFGQCTFPVLTTPNLGTAMFRLNKLFAQSYGIYKYTPQTSNYQLCNIGSGYDDTGGIDCDPTLGIADVNMADDPARAIKAPDVVNIKLNGQTGDVYLNAPGGMVSLSFNSNLDNDQLPLDYIAVDWKDSPNYDQFYVSMSEQPGVDNPHTLSHFYQCVPNSEGDRCSFCWNDTSNTWTPAPLTGPNAGSCVYEGPAITLQDHWEWCANSVYSPDAYCSPYAAGTPVFGGNIYIRPRL